MFKKITRARHSVWTRTWKDLLRDVVGDGSAVSRKETERDSSELVSHKFTIDDPRDRLIYSVARPINIFQCIGHFLWITQGNFNLDAISYYQPKAKEHSSDQIKVIGAYGPRLFGIGHMNQIENLLDTLHQDSGKRKAVASIYLPHFDQHGLSREEVPCTLNLQYLVRKERLLALTYMRSQDAFNVLPYDAFIFTMLQEYVQCRLAPGGSKELGPYYHYSGSFHTYEKDRERILKVLDEPDSEDLRMLRMPYKDVQLRLGDMNEFESIVRTSVAAREKRGAAVNFESMFELADNMLRDEYWRQIGYLLILYGARKLQDGEHQDAARDRLRAPYGELVDAMPKS